MAPPPIAGAPALVGLVVSSVVVAVAVASPPAAPGPAPGDAASPLPPAPPAPPKASAMFEVSVGLVAGALGGAPGPPAPPGGVLLVPLIGPTVTVDMRSPREIYRRPAEAGPADGWCGHFGRHGSRIVTVRNSSQRGWEAKKRRRCNERSDDYVWLGE